MSLGLDVVGLELGREPDWRAVIRILLLNGVRNAAVRRIVGVLRRIAAGHDPRHPRIGTLDGVLP